MPSPPSTLLRRSVLAAATLSAVLAAATAADAATLTRAADGTLVYLGGPASAKLDVQAGDGTQAVFYGVSQDAVTSYPADCGAEYDASVITCAAPPAVQVDLGPGDDHGQVSDDVTFPVHLAGGAGRDWLEGTDRDDVLDGGPGDDRLTAYGGHDVLTGGDGDDELDGGAGDDALDAGPGNDLLRPDEFEDPGADVVDGGPGMDRLQDDYVSRFTDIHPLVDLTLAGGADDGRPGEHDDLRSVEAVTLSVGGRFAGTDGPDEIVLQQVDAASVLSGGGGEDHLRGGGGADTIDGGPGADTLDGGFGDDQIVGGPGPDAIHADQAGGACGTAYCTLPYGNDVVDARDGEVDTVDCGVGADRVLADAVDVVAADCEQVDRGPAPASGGGVQAGGGSSGGGSPAGGAPGQPDGGVRVAVVGSRRLSAVLRHGLHLRLAGLSSAVTARALLGRTTVATGRGRTSVTLRVSATGRRRLQAARRPTVTVVVGVQRLRVSLTA